MEKSKLLWSGLAVTIILSVSSSGCDSSSSGSSSISTKHYLAKNVIFRESPQNEQQSLKSNHSFSFFSKAHAGDIDLDTETKVFADNVVYSNDASISSVKSTNVQDAINELSLIFSKVMIGEWNIENKNSEDYHSIPGKVAINDDGTFDLTEGSFAAIGEGSGENSSFCNNTNGTEKYTAITDEVIIFEHASGGATNQVIPQVASLKEDKIILVGSGGCGNMGIQRVSILTRVTEPSQ